MPRIRRLDVEGFRGIRNATPLLFDGKSVLLFGENGTGKSSFVDALEKLLTGHVSTLDGRAQSLSSDRHGPHIRSDGGPPAISITFDDHDETVLSLSAISNDLSAPIVEYMRAAKENLFILRRRQVLEFIDSQPRQRYDLIHPFLPLMGVEAIEEALRQARDRVESDARGASQQAQRITQEIQSLFGGQPFSNPPTEPELIGAINQSLMAIGQQTITSLGELAVCAARLSETLASFGDLSVQSRLSNAIEALEELTSVIPRVHEIPLQVTLEQLRAKETEEAKVFYEVVLEQGARWISDESRSTCPLCEQPINADQVVTRSQERLSAMLDILNLRKESKRFLDVARQAARYSLDTVERAENRVRVLSEGDSAVPMVAVARARHAIETLSETLSAELGAIDLVKLSHDFAQTAKSDVVATELSQCALALRTRLSSLPSAQSAQGLLSLSERANRVLPLWETLHEALASARISDSESLAASKVYEEAQAARKQEVQSLFDELSGEIDGIYQSLHPDENHSGIRLEIREAVQASVNLRAGFYERQDEDPRAYFSDAHLDTLGLSIFLALRRWHRRQNPTFDLIVLDDVLTSVDTAHSVRLSEILLSEFRDYQILLTTHDRIWYEHLRDIQARCGVGQSFINKIIHKWTIEDGPDLREPEDEQSALDRLLQDGTPEQIAVMAGRLLEHTLQEMRYSLRLSVQARRGEQYEIGELWPAFYSKIKKDYPTLYQEASPALDSLDIRWPVRNWIGAHWNTWARNVSSSTATEFGKAVLILFDKVFCPTCRRFIAPSTTPLGQLACRCGTRIYSAPGKTAVSPKTREELVRDTQAAFKDAQLDTARYFDWKRAEAGGEN